MGGEQASGGPNRGKRPVIRVQRRRPAGEGGREGRARAEAPRREGRGGVEPAPDSFSTQDASRPSYGQGGNVLPTGVKLPSCSGRMLVILGGLALIAACIFVAFIYLSGGFEGGGAADYPTDIPVATTASSRPTTAPSGATLAPVSTVKPFVAPTRSASGQRWLVMLYQDADDRVLEQDIYVDLNEAERVGSSDRVQIVAQLDRYAGAYSGDGNWTSTRRYYVTKDDDLGKVRSQLVADLGEKNMADGATLVDFCAWAVKTFPADKYVLILSDHGMGWPGGWTDPAPSSRGDTSTPLSSRLGNQLYLMQLDAALNKIQTSTGKLEIIGLDACLMGQVEVLSSLAPYANYAVVSEETEPALGWAYTRFLGALSKDPDMTGAELSKLIVTSFVRDDQRIVDDQARAELAQQGSPMGSLFGAVSSSSASQMASQMGRDTTLSAVDLSAVPTLMDSLNSLAVALQGAGQSEVARARTYAQSFTSIFGEEVPASYIDLGSFVSLLKQTRAGSAVSKAADGVLGALGKAIVAERHGSGKPGATGVAIYFPNSQLFKSSVAGPESYSIIASRFAGDSLWDDFLAFHYTGTRFDASALQAVIPKAGTAIRGPGAGTLTLSPIELSDSTAAPGRPVLLSTDISATNLGYVYLFAGYYDRLSNSIFVADMDYLESSDTREVNGVFYPVWPDREFTIEFEWEPLMFAISDGTRSVEALLTPHTYGATDKEATYTVDGTYTDAGGASQTARLYFRDGVLRQVMGFSGDDAAGSPHEIYPQRGDRFTILEHWLDLDSQGRVVQQATEDGDTLTFGSQMFTWKELDAAVGEYVVGFVAEDLDGNRQQVYARVTVE